MRIAALSGLWDVQETTMTLTLGTWEEILPADPTRWFLSITGPSGSVFYTTRPDLYAGTVSALSTPMFQPIELKYQDAGPLVQAPWFGVTIGGPLLIGLMTASVRRQAEREPRGP